VDQIMALLRISRTPVYFADHFRPYSEPQNDWPELYIPRAGM
jgi:hypothetical protein